jgi:hypothetical protein
VAVCGGKTPEVDRTFTILFRDQGRPLKGVQVRVLGVGSKEVETVSGPDGKAKFSNLEPGDYTLSADLLGIAAGYQCFHIARHGSLLARRSLQFDDWGASAIITHLAAGHIRSSEPGNGSSQIWRVTHRTKVPIQLAQLRLRDPFTGLDLLTRSDKDGIFAFEHLPAGDYVLHIEGNESNVQFDPTDILIRVDPNTTVRPLDLLKVESGCGGSYLQPERN